MKENFCARNYTKSWEFLKEGRKYILFAVIIFLLFAIIGFVFPIFFREQVLALLEGLMGVFEGKGVYETIGLIFLNNVQASFLGVVLGIVFGVFPIMTAVVNGYILGFVANAAVGEAGIGVLWRLLPHGIFELPAIMVSIGLGLKIGFELFKGRLKENFVESLRVFLFIVIPLLVIAAVIEGLLVVLVG